MGDTNKYMLYLLAEAEKLEKEYANEGEYGTCKAQEAKNDVVMYKQIIEEIDEEDEKAEDDEDENEDDQGKTKRFRVGSYYVYAEEQEGGAPKMWSETAVKVE